jgi:hypothetical protein
VTAAINGHLTEASALHAALEEAHIYGPQWQAVTAAAGDVNGHPMVQLRLIRRGLDESGCEANKLIARDVPAQVFIANASRAWAELRRMHEDAKRWLEV